MPSKEPRINEAAIAALARAELADTQMKAFEYAIRGIRQYDRNDKTVENAIQVLFGLMWEAKGRAYESVFMWGMLSQEERYLIKKKTLQMLLESQEDMHHHFDHTLSPTSNYDDTKVEELKEELEKQRLSLKKQKPEAWHERFEER